MVVEAFGQREEFLLHTFQVDCTIIDRYTLDNRLFYRREGWRVLDERPQMREGACWRSYEEEEEVDPGMEAEIEALVLGGR